jgi:hypothetical protein
MILARSTQTFRTSSIQSQSGSVLMHSKLIASMCFPQTPSIISHHICRKNSGRRLTEHRSAIVQIKNFRPTFCRVPLGNNVRQQSPDSHLALEIGSVEFLGSENEGQFGNPKDIEEDQKVMAWTKGLREHGGGGYVLFVSSNSPFPNPQILVLSNVLKLRKEAEQASSKAETSPARASRIPPRKLAQDTPKRTSQVAKKRADSRNKTEPTSPTKTGVSAVKHPLDLYYRQFRVCLQPTKFCPNCN